MKKGESMNNGKYTIKKTIQAAVWERKKENIIKEYEIRNKNEKLWKKIIHKLWKCQNKSNRVN